MTQTIRGAPRPGRFLPLVLLALGACMAGCSDDDDGGGATPPATTAGTGGAGGSGGAGKGGSNPGGNGGTGGGTGGAGQGGAGSGGAAGSGLSLSVKAVGGSDTAKLPFDATPDPDGTAVYFTAVGVEGNGVYKVTLADGAQSTLFEGEPLANPVSIAISDDGKTLFLADPAAEDASGDEGQIFSVPTGGGAPTALAGVGGRSPRGLDVRGDKVYFSGRTKGIAGVYTTPTAGGSAAALLEGAPLVDPVGLVANKGGEVFVLDAATPGGATLFKISGGQATALAEGLKVGFPAGVALNLDESAVMVSAINPDTGNDLVWVINTTSGSQSMFDDTIGQFQEAAGLHRAKNKEMFAWADSKANNTGKVFVLQK